MKQTLINKTTTCKLRAARSIKTSDKLSLQVVLVKYTKKGPANRRVPQMVVNICSTHRGDLEPRRIIGIVTKHRHRVSAAAAAAATATNCISTPEAVWSTGGGKALFQHNFLFRFYVWKKYTYEPHRKSKLWRWCEHPIPHFVLILRGSGRFPPYSIFVVVPFERRSEFSASYSIPPSTYVIIFIWKHI